MNRNQRIYFKNNIAYYGCLILAFLTWESSKLVAVLFGVIALLHLIGFITIKFNENE